MEQILNDVEVRVLGSLIEKGIATPEYYPLTLNALTRACNQKSNRHPVVSFDEKAVVRAVEGLMDRKLARRVIGDDSRVPKYRHIVTEAFAFTEPEVAAVCMLLLRGPQTPGEIRGRAERLYSFGSLEEVESTLRGLMDRAAGPLVVQLPRQPGRKESRYAHLFSGEIEVEQAELLEPAALEVHAENERIASLEHEVESLRQEIEDLRQEFAEFRKQFE